ncbi:hypothetical protein [Mycobacterium sp. SMC-15]|uniref:hypothetical protein n=1 Tax=Mycobacterium sp. SMC-15 TaxID=3381627 RepID=UPI0038768BC7
MTPHSPVAPPHRWQFVALTVGLIATAAVAIAGVAIALSRPAHSVVTYSAEEKAEAKTQLCDRYKIAVRASQIETAPGGDPALARISMLNGALMLETASANPALDVKYGDAARALAVSFQTQAAMASGESADSMAWHQIVDDTNAKDRVVKELCGT